MRAFSKAKVINDSLRLLSECKCKALNQTYLHEADTNEEFLAIIREARGGSNVTPCIRKRSPAALKTWVSEIGWDGIGRDHFGNPWRVQWYLESRDRSADPKHVHQSNLPRNS